MGHQVPLLFTCEPVQGQPQTSPVIAAPLVLVLHPRRDRHLLLEPIRSIQIRSTYGSSCVAAPTGTLMSDLVGRGHHNVDGGLGMGVHAADAISTVPMLLIRTHAPMANC